MDKAELKKALAKLGIKATDKGAKKSEVVKALKKVSAEEWFVPPETFEELQSIGDPFWQALNSLRKNTNKAEIRKAIGKFEGAWDDLWDALGEGHY